MRSLATQTKDQPPAPPAATVEAPKDTALTLRGLLDFLGPRGVALAVASVAVGTSLFVVEVLFAFCTQALLLLLGGNSVPSTRLQKLLALGSLKSVLILIVISGALRAVFSWANVWLQLVAPAEFSHYQRTRILNWVFRSKTVSSQRATDLFTEQISVAGHMVRAGQVFLARGTVTFFLGLCLAALCPGVFLATLALMSVLAPAARSMNRHIRVASDGVLREWRDVNQRVGLGIRNLLLLRIYGAQERERAAASESLDEHLAHQSRQFAAAGVIQTLPQVAGILLLCLITGLAGTKYGMRPDLTIAYLYLVGRFLQSATGTADGFSGLFLYLPQTRELYQWWRAHGGETFPATINPTAGGSAPKPLESPVGWKLRNVAFGYPAQPPVLQAVDLEINPGTVTVVMGPSGVGKSTFLALLLGQLEPTSGTVELILGNKVQRVSTLEKALLASIGYVGPEPFMNEGTIYENLVYSLERPPSEVELARAMERAQCQFIRELPQGMQHSLNGQGQGLSAGQKQRLSLMRALLRNPKVLILDEATANLDADTEQKLVDALGSLKGELTIVAVTHRRELLRISDRQIQIQPGGKVA